MIKAVQLLHKVAQEYQLQRTTFSRQEIVKKLNEIKYLSAQRKVPRLTLRKEIIHLEHKLQSLFEIETTLAKQKKQEQYKINLFKKQIRALEARVASSADKDLQKKVDKLSSLLGEYSAQKKTKEEITQIEQSTIKKRSEDQNLLRSNQDLNQQNRARASRIEMMQQRLQLLKQELQLTVEKGQNVAQLKLNISFFEDKLAQLDKMTVPNAVSAVPMVIDNPADRHTLLFDLPKLTPEEETELEQELPLPPPPKVRKRT